MSRALPPVEVHLTLNVAVPSTTSILTDTAVTVRKSVGVFVLVLLGIRRQGLTGVEDVQSSWCVYVINYTTIVISFLSSIAASPQIV